MGFGALRLFFPYPLTNSLTHSNLAPCTERLCHWLGTDSTLAPETAQTKPQREQTLQGFKPTQSKEFPPSFCNGNLSKLDFQGNSIAGSGAAHLPQAFSRAEDCAQSFPGGGQHGPNYIHLLGFMWTHQWFGLMHSESQILASRGQCVSTPTQILQGPMSFKEKLDQKLQLEFRQHVSRWCRQSNRQPGFFLREPMNRVYLPQELAKLALCY